MKKKIGKTALLGAALLLSAACAAAAPPPACLLLVELGSGKALAREGRDCDTRTSPSSSFKLALALIGFDAGLLKDEHHPLLPFKKGYVDWRESWKTDIDPTSWQRESVVWYSQELTRKLGAARFQQGVDRLQYGNRDLRGEPGKHNGLSHAWLSTSLKISPAEQVALLRKLLLRTLPVSPSAIDHTMAIVPRFELDGGMVVHGKTGTGHLPGGELPFGWFVGWVEKQGQVFVFARLITESANADQIAGFQARDEMLRQLPELLSK